MEISTVFLSFSMIFKFISMRKTDNSVANFFWDEIKEIGGHQVEVYIIVKSR